MPNPRSSSGGSLLLTYSTSFSFTVCVLLKMQSTNIINYDMKLSSMNKYANELGRHCSWCSGVDSISFCINFLCSVSHYKKTFSQYSLILDSPNSLLYCHWRGSRWGARWLLVDQVDLWPQEPTRGWPLMTSSDLKWSVAAGAEALAGWGRGASEGWGRLPASEDAPRSPELSTVQTLPQNKTTPRV